MSAEISATITLLPTLQLRLIPAFLVEEEWFELGGLDEPAANNSVSPDHVRNNFSSLFVLKRTFRFIGG